MLPLEKYRLNIPALWEEDWQKAVNSADGVRKRIVIIQARTAYLLQNMDGCEATPERIAWLTIWSRLFAILRGVSGALEMRNSQLLEVIYRMVMECSVQVQTILEPVAKLWKAKSKSAKVIVSKSFENIAWEQVRSRMQAYTAWCLWNDRMYYAESLHPRTISDLWDMGADLRIEAARKQHPEYEQVFGPIEIETNPKRFLKKKREMQEALRTDLARCDDWLNDPRLASWKQKLDELQKQIGNSISFFRLLAEETKSFSKKLRELDMRWMYSGYMSGSMILHGSSVDQLLCIGEDFFSPNLVGTTEDECEASASSICEKSQEIGFHLLMFQRIL